MPLRSNPIELASVLLLRRRRSAIVQGQPDYVSPRLDPDFGAELLLDPAQELLQGRRIEPDIDLAKRRIRRHIAITALNLDIPFAFPSLNLRPMGGTIKLGFAHTAFRNGLL